MTGGAKQIATVPYPMATPEDLEATVTAVEPPGGAPSAGEHADAILLGAGLAITKDDR